MEELWQHCINDYFKTGRMLMASNMQIGKRTLQGNVLHIEFPSEGTKITFEENIYELVNFLRNNLNNYEFSIQTTVNESVEIKKMYTIEDKLSMLKEKYPVIEQLIKTFDLKYKY